MNKNIIQQYVDALYFLPILLILLSAFNEALMVAEEASDIVQEVTSPIQNTVLGIWADFVDRIPFLVSGLAVVLATWLAAVLLPKII